MNANIIQTTKIKAARTTFMARRQTRKQILNRYQAVARQNPHFQAALFDKHFVTSDIIPAVQTGNLNAGRIANNWADQINLKPASRRELVNQLIPLIKEIANC